MIPFMVLRGRIGLFSPISSHLELEAILIGDIAVAGNVRAVLLVILVLIAEGDVWAQRIRSVGTVDPGVCVHVRSSVMTG